MTTDTSTAEPLAQPTQPEAPSDAPSDSRPATTTVDNRTAADTRPLPPSPAPPWSGPPRPDTDHGWQRLVIPVAVVVLLVGWVILREADRLVRGVVSPGGVSASLGDVTGVFALFNGDAWEAWASSPDVAQLPVFVSGYIVGDALFMAGYFVLLSLLSWRTLFGLVALLAGVALDGLESVLVLLTSFGVSALGPTGGVPGYLAPGGALPISIAWVSILKWVALGVVVAAVLVVRASRHALWHRVQRAAIGLWVHRLTLLFVAGFGILALSPTSGIFDQLPDVQREWFGDGSFRYFVPVLGHTGASFFVLLVVAALFWYFGRRRTERAYRRLIKNEVWPAAEASIGWWVAVPTAGVAVAVLATYWGASARGWILVAVVCLIAVAVAARAADMAWQGGKLSRAGVLVPLAIIAGLAGWAWLHGAHDLVALPYLLVVVAVSAVVIGASAVLRRRWKRRPETEPDRPFTATTGFSAVLGLDQSERMTDTFRTTWLVGDALAVMVVAIAPLGLIRSLTGPALSSLAARVVEAERLRVGERGTAVVSDAAAGLPLVWIALLVSLVAIVPLIAATVFAARAVDRHLSVRQVEADRASLGRLLIDPTLPVPREKEGAVAGVDVAAVLVGAALVSWATFWPTSFAGMGPVVVTVMLLTAWSLIIGGIVLSMQRAKPMPIFRQLGMASNPLITIVTLFAFLMSLWAAPAELHGVRVIGAQVAERASMQSVDERLTAALGARFRAWLDRAPDCGDAPTPLLLIASEGGGARAAYWTVSAMAELRRDACLGGALFVASGVSGGSVGLAIDQVVPGIAGDEPDARTPQESAVTALTGPTPLARVVTGFLGGDYVAALTGVRVPTVGGVWVDRAGHLEDAWADEVPLLDGPFRQAAAARHPFLVLNSADSVSGCRVSITQLRIPRSSAAWGGADRLTGDDCGAPTTGAGFATEFDEVWPDCSGNLRWSTAAMLSARFPFVTPGGRMPATGAAGCMGVAGGDDGIPQAQLVDGGYSDASGLGALSDLMPEIVRLVSDHNACVATPREAGTTAAEIEAACDGSAVQLMPVVIYLKNERGFELDAEAERLAAEFLVPLAGAKAKGLQNGEQAWLQRLSDDVAELKTPDGCRGEVCARPVVVLSAATSPTIAAPLGWTLSELSRDSLDAALDANEQRCGSVDGYPTLGELLATFSGTTCNQE